MAWLVLGVVSVAVVAGLVGWVRRLQARHPEPLWDWNALAPELDRVVFPPDFRWGTATAHHQIEGGHTANNWARWETVPDASGRSRIQHGDVSGDAADHWNRWREDLDRMVDDLGVDVYRFSVSWSRIQPEPGRYDPEAIAHYHALIDHLIARGVTPMLTLHHFAHPLWFEDLGGFESEAALAHLERFTTRMFEEYGAKVPLWCTINEPGPYAVMGFGLGVFPPGVRSARRLFAVIRNLCVAHVRMVAAIRRCPGGDAVEVGLVHNIFQLDPWKRHNPVHWLLCRVADHVYNESFLRFIRTGRVRVGLPLVGFGVDERIDGDRGDFVGLNYYANLLLDPFMPREPPFDAHLRPGQVLTDMPYTIYAEGFWRALHRIQKTGLPVWVTENGAADAQDDGRRATWIRRYLYAMRRAMSEGVDVRGYCYWSLLDNFEWAEGFQMRFGLYAVDYDTQERTLRAGARPLVEAIARSRGTAT